MCNYCGCRSIEPIARLTEDHDHIQNLAGEVGRYAAHGEHAAAVASLARLRELLRVHDTVEELSVYPAMARQPEYAEKVATLFDEHDDSDAVIDEALATAAATGPSSVGWAPVLAVFDILVDHIQHEEYGLFPAAAIALDEADWEQAQRVRAAAVAGTVTDAGVTQ